MTAESTLIFIYLSLFLLAVVLSFTTRKQPRRRHIRIATAISTAPILVFIAVAVVLWFIFGKEPPTLAALQHDFPSRRADLETILRMSDEDPDFSRIAPNFVDRTTDDPKNPGRYMEGDREARLPESRWNTYREIYRRNGIKLGVQMDASGDAFIMVNSIGILESGHTTGYLHCTGPAVPADTVRFQPCLLHQEKGEHNFNPDTKEEGYSFQIVDDHWYAYDEGPS